MVGGHQKEVVCVDVMTMGSSPGIALRSCINLVGHFPFPLLAAIVLLKNK